MTTPPLDRRVDVTHLERDRFDISIDGIHDIDVDQPVTAGGDGSAPTPTDLFVASLAACQAFYAQRFLTRHGIDTDVKVSCAWAMGGSPARVTDVAITFEGLALPEELEERFRRVVDRCTVHNTLRQPPQITVAFGHDALGAAS